MKRPLHYLIYATLGLSSLSSLAQTKSSDASIKGFFVAKQAEMEITNQSIRIYSNLNPKNLTAEVVLAPGATISPDPSIPHDVKPGIGENYTVTAEDGTQKVWSVTLIEDILAGLHSMLVKDGVFYQNYDDVPGTTLCLNRAVLRGTHIRPTQNFIPLIDSIAKAKLNTVYLDIYSNEIFGGIYEQIGQYCAQKKLFFIGNIVDSINKKDYPIDHLLKFNARMQAPRNFVFMNTDRKYSAYQIGNDINTENLSQAEYNNFLLNYLDSSNFSSFGRFYDLKVLNAPKNGKDLLGMKDAYSFLRLKKIFPDVNHKSKENFIFAVDLNFTDKDTVLLRGKKLYEIFAELHKARIPFIVTNYQTEWKDDNGNMHPNPIGSLDDVLNAARVFSVGLCIGNWNEKDGNAVDLSIDGSSSNLSTFGKKYIEEHPFSAQKKEFPLVKTFDNTCMTQNKQRTFTSFKFPRQRGKEIIDTTTTIFSPSARIIVDVLDSNLTNLNPAFSVSANAEAFSFDPNPNDFSKPRTYFVTAENGDVREFKVYVFTADTRSPENKILAFKIPNTIKNETIDTIGKVVNLYVAPNYKLDTVMTSVSLSPKASSIPASGMVTDFQKNMSYTVIAENGNLAYWTVNVNTVSGITEDLAKTTKIWSYKNDLGQFFNLQSVHELNGEIQILDGLGRIVKTWSVKDRMNFDASLMNLSSGIYCISYREGNSYLTLKVLID